ncbi:predicted protein [Naegleria gruberi]|uniref:Predicted protein n=1 Tax=Naegleria gruberi TaxID=5762 RepID=D2W6N8_NAEGR|nr:uncharacterized protein NAEGRDRAFT_77082 [Naegleria gruberi]EFC35264.1 predicted protein [Naegleria gruberi]|eukprot:XP_002668008.1 predicted protein [Naegleria gruberi strain NEG-M]
MQNPNLLYTNYLICVMVGLRGGVVECNKFVESLGSSIISKSSSLLSSQESLFLNSSFLSEQRRRHGGEFKFRMNQRIAFLQGNSFTQWSKNDYFKNVKEFNYGTFENGAKEFSRADQLYILNEKEQLESGGYEAILLSWSKVDMSYKREKVIENLKRNFKEFE